MLRSHAYCAAIDRDACDAGARIANRLEVGRRARRHALLRSASSWRHESGDQQQQSCRCSAEERGKHLHLCALLHGKSVSGLRNRKARGGGSFRELGRPSPSIHSPQSTAQLGRHASSVSGRTFAGGFSREFHPVFAHQCCSRGAYGLGAYHGLERARDHNHSYGAFCRPTGIHRAATDRTYTQAAAETATATAQSWIDKQLASGTPPVLRSEYAASENRSAHERASQTLILISLSVDRSMEAV